MLKIQPEMAEAMKVNQFHVHLRKKELQKFQNINATNKGTLEEVLILPKKTLNSNHEQLLNTNAVSSLLTQIQNHSETF